MANIATIQGEYDDNTPWQASMTAEGKWACEDELVLAKLEIHYDPRGKSFGSYDGKDIAVIDAAKDLDAKITWGQ